MNETNGQPSTARRRRDQARSHAFRGAIEPLESRLLFSTVVVNTTADVLYPSGSGTVSLRNAVAIANSSANTTITFSPSVFSTAKTITLNGNDLDLDGSGTTTLIGPSVGVTLDANHKSDVFEVDAFATASFSNFTMTHGDNSGLNNYGTLTLTGVSILNSSTPNEYGGGGLYNEGTATLDKVTISGNIASKGYGGGIFTAGTLSITDSTISNNMSEGGFNGGGIDNNSGSVYLLRDTLSGNSAIHGGGFYNNATADIVDSTLANNTASGNGGGLANYGTVTIYDDTIAGNHASCGGGIFSFLCVTCGCGCDGTPGPPLMIANTIVANNTAATGPDVSGQVDSLGHNLVERTDGSSGWISSDLTGTIAHPLDPKLGPLASNGGPTQTFLPLTGSPAIDHGNNSFIPTGITTDQRGLPRIANNTVDIGSVEVQAPIVVPPDSITAKPVSFSGNEGRILTPTVATFVDPKLTAPLSGFGATINWGDNSSSKGTVVSTGGGNYKVTGSHVYAEENAKAYSVVVTITDTAGSHATVTASGKINESPTDSPVGISTLTAKHGVSFANLILGSFRDQDALNRTPGDYSGTITWGDGTTSSAGFSFVSATSNVGSYWHVIGSHKYATAKTYTITISLHDTGNIDNYITIKSTIKVT